MKKRVVITGLGVVSPIGNDVDIMWQNVKSGTCGIDFITRFDTENFKAKLAAEVKDLNVEDFIPKQEVRKLDRYTQFAIIGALKAYEDAKITEINKERMGVILSSGIGGLETIENNHEKLVDKGPDRVSPHFIPMSLVNLAAGNVAITLGAKGVCLSVVTACAASTDAIGMAFKYIQNGDLDAVVAGGAEASITPLGIAGFSVMKAVTESIDPKRASIPFDAERSGFVMGEGAGVIILESLDYALARGAKIYGELVGYGATCDAHHITAPDPTGDGAIRAMNMAINDAGISPKDIDYINAHGTSTPLNDKTETAAVKEVFKESANKLAMSSTKSMTGHLLGAAGAVEAIISIKALEEGFLPPTIGYKEKDPDCDLDIVANQGRSDNIKYAMSNSLGFGGHNACIVIKKWEGN